MRIDETSSTLEIQCGEVFLDLLTTESGGLRVSVDDFENVARVEFSEDEAPSGTRLSGSSSELRTTARTLCGQVIFGGSTPSVTVIVVPGLMRARARRGSPLSRTWCPTRHSSVTGWWLSTLPRSRMKISSAASSSSVCAR
jgi:hypothetical protein